MIGILDSEGINNNPLTNKPYSDKYKSLAKYWKQLPAYDQAESIIKIIKKNQVTLIISGTGSGKTVLIPKFALHATDYKGKIAVTLPKQIVTKSAAEYAAETLDVKLGKEVGYQFKGDKKISDNTELLYATDGTIVAMLMKDQLLSGYDMVIIDEAHERKVQIDFLLYLLKQTLRLRPEFKVIIMSATVNEEIFKKYFDEFSYETINIGGKTNYPIESIYLNKPITEKEYLDVGFETLVKIIKSDDVTAPGSHDILYFVPSVSETKEICERMAARPDLNVFCIEVYSGINKEQEDLARDANKYKVKSQKLRKVVLATNVAESSLTIDGIKYVIDSGYEFFGSYDPLVRARKLDKKRITKAQVKQRKGRSGRTSPGICYHLYTEKEYNNMEDYPEPSIRTSDIKGECLRLLNTTRIKDISELKTVLNQFIEPPKDEYVASAIDDLIKIGLIDNKQINAMGKFIADTRLDPLPGKTIIYSLAHNCSREVLKIISVLLVTKSNMNELFHLPKNILTVDNKQQLESLQKKFDKSQRAFKSVKGDHLTILRVYEKYDDYKKNNSDKITDWCYKHFIKKNTLDDAKKTYRQLKNNIQQINKSSSLISVNQAIINKDVKERIMYCFEEGFSINKAIKKGSDYYNTDYDDKKIRLNQISTLNDYKTLPKHVVYNEYFISMGKNELSVVSKI